MITSEFRVVPKENIKLRIIDCNNYALFMFIHSPTFFFFDIKLESKINMMSRLYNFKIIKSTRTMFANFAMNLPVNIQQHLDPYESKRKYVH